jgi:hypothetical protein
LILLHLRHSFQIVHNEGGVHIAEILKANTAITTIKYDTRMSSCPLAVPTIRCQV